MHHPPSSPEPTGRYTLWGKRLGLLAIVSVVTSAGIYGIGLQKPPQTATFTATATIDHATPSTTGTNNPPDTTEQWLSDWAAWEATRAENGDPARIARIRRNLRISSGKGQTAGSVRTTLTYTSTTADDAIQTVNHLARRFAEQKQSIASSWVRDSLARAEGATEQARQELLAAQWELEQFVRRYFEQLRQGKSNFQPAPATPAQTESQVPPVEEEIRKENPEWRNLRDQVARLRRQREEMLIVRTPLHPAVRDVGTELARLEALLPSVPQYLAGEQAVGTLSSATVRPPVPLPPLFHVSEAENRDHPPPNENEVAASEGFAIRQGTVEKARQKYEAMAAAERRTRQQELLLILPEVQLAERCDRAAGREQSNRLLAVALAAGLAMATGVGMVWAGAVPEMMLSSVADVQAALPLPVVGVVPMPGRAEPMASGWRMNMGTGTLMVIGGIAIVVIVLASLFLFLIL